MDSFSVHLDLQADSDRRAVGTDIRVEALVEDVQADARVERIDEVVQVELERVLVDVGEARVVVRGAERAEQLELAGPGRTGE
jgi:hypothetical protein